MFEIFKSYQFNKEKAHAYGFVENEEVWTYSCQILQGDFYMTVSITPDNVSFLVFDQETGDLYPQVHMESMRGSFVGSVREACLEILYQIRKACFDVQDFICPQTKRIMAQVQKKYGNQLEAIDWLSQAGVTRILTRAGVSGDSLEKRFAHYRRILEHSAGKIEILPGGGIDLDNRQNFIDQLGVTQLHGTKVVF